MSAAIAQSPISLIPVGLLAKPKLSYIADCFRKNSGGWFVAEGSWFASLRQLTDYYGSAYEMVEDVRAPKPTFNAVDHCMTEEDIF